GFPGEGLGRAHATGGQVAGRWRGGVAAGGSVPFTAGYDPVMGAGARGGTAGAAGGGLMDLVQVVADARMQGDSCGASWGSCSGPRWAPSPQLAPAGWCRGWGRIRHGRGWAVVRWPPHPVLAVARAVVI